MPRTPRLTTAAAVCLLALPATALAAGEPRGLAISPSSLDVAVEPGRSIGPITLRNSSPRTVGVKIGVASLAQARSGLAVLDAGAPGKQRAARLVKVSRDRVVIRPGGVARVSARVLRRPASGVGAYAAITFHARALARSPRDISPTLVMSTNLLLRFPGRPAPRMHLAGLRAEQLAPGKVGLVADVANRGNVHAKARQALAVRDAAGRVVERGRIVPENVLPGATRRFTVGLARSLPAGAYSARMGGRRVSFDLVAPDTLPTPRLAIARLGAPQTDSGEGYEVPVTVRSAGNTPARGRVAVRVTDRAGRPVGAGSAAVGPLDPGGRATARVALPGVPAGSYRVAARIEVRGGAPVSDSVEFATHAQPGSLDRLRDRLAAVNLAVAGVVAALLLALAGLAAYTLRLRRCAQAARCG